MASFSTTSAKAGSGKTGGGAWAQAKATEEPTGILGKIKAIEKEMGMTQKNKATSSHLGSLKAKLCQLKRDLLEPGPGSGGGKQPGFEVQRMGDCRIGIVGFPSVGKSSLLSALTGVKSEVASYDFTTLTCIPGVIYYENIRIQLLDLPGIIVGASIGKGRGRQVIATAKSCDIIIMALDASKDDEQKEMLTKELSDIGIRLNRKPPLVNFNRTKGGGLRFNATVKTAFDRDQCDAVLKQYRIFNADVVVHEDITVDDFIDVIDGNRKYCQCLYVYNKIDLLNIAETEELARMDSSVVISVNAKMNLDYLLDRMWATMQVVRVYTKKKGQFPDFKDPIVMTPQRGNKTFTVENAVGLLHKSILDEFKHCLVWGRSVKVSPQAVGLKHELMDEDVIQIVKMTQAEIVRARDGKKTGQTIAGSNIKVEKK